MAIIPLILSGGSGSRLWPVSRMSLPKQFIEFSDNETFFSETLKRAYLINNNINPIVISSKSHGFLCKKEAKKLNIDANYIFEEMGRNTAASIYFGALNINPKDLICIMPSDHWIGNNDKLVLKIKSGVQKAEEGKWITFGIQPTEPSAAYGYIKTKKNNTKIYEVEQFKEKPNEKIAELYLKEGSYFWNSGIFLVSAETCINSFKRLQPKFTDACNICWENRVDANNEINLLKQYLEKIPSTSIDYSIMEKENNISLIPFDDDWCDLGNWESLSNFLVKKNKSKTNAPNILLDSHNSFIYSKNRTIAGIGLTDVIIVDEDDATLVVKKSHVEKVKEVLSQLKKLGNPSAIEHSYEYRPWGKFENLYSSALFKVKRLIINPAQHLSLQYHYKRSEHWVIVKGSARVTLNKKVIILNAGQSIDIPAKAHHSIGNETDVELIMIEVQMGTYFGEDDIVRISDPYGR